MSVSTLNFRQTMIAMSCAVSSEMDPSQPSSTTKSGSEPTVSISSSDGHQLSRIQIMEDLETMSSSTAGE